MKLNSIRYFPAIACVAAFVCLSVLLNFTYPADHFSALQLLQPSIDVWLLFVLLGLAACSGERLLFLTLVAVWVLFLVLRLIRIGDTVVPMYFNRPFNLYLDSGYLFSLYDLLTTSADKKSVVLTTAGGTAVVLGFMALSWFAWRTVARALAGKKVRFFFLGGSSLILSLALLRGWGPTATPIIVRLGQEIVSIRHQQQLQQAVMVRIEQVARERNNNPATLTGLKGADVLVFMVESYGQIVYTSPEYRQAMESTMSELAEILAQHGFKAVSSSLISPTYGGGSHLAHSTLEFGLKVGNDLEHNALLRSSLPPLASYFHRSGYRTVSVMPGTRFVYPEGDRFGYDKAYYARHFNYQGPTFGWAPMADQFVLDWVRRHEFVRRAQPLFIRYVLISSHAAFSIQPPFIADWDSIGNGSLYNNLQLIRYPIFWPNLKNAARAYLRSLDYEFTLLGDYLAKYVSADTLIIVMGDHQPNLQLTGEGQSWSVPVHIISRNSLLLDPFRKRGYTPGLVPAQPSPHTGMETFFQNFLQDFR